MLLVDVHCADESMQWQILQAFIGRVVDHFGDVISAINIQLA
jgi:hypothetical protein